MKEDKNTERFLALYDAAVNAKALELRKLIFKTLPDIIEQVDTSAKMIGYCYGQKYAELICIIIPSKKGLKLGFNRGVELDDPDGLLEGEGKISRYVVIHSEQKINSAGIKKLLLNELKLYKLVLK
ncbi:MAG: DUF1801 domain-containing protein [Chitinophagales bacterium]